MGTTRASLPMPAMQDLQRTVNARVYRTARVVREYAAQRDLPCNEGAALMRYRDAFADRAVLDIGVGAGRTTRFIAPLAARYECIDYSPAMVEYMQRTLPAISTRQGDACNLNAFGDGSFDFVFGSNCVIDALSPSDRLSAMREAARVLRLGGTYMFSSHNLDYEHAMGGPRLDLSGGFVAALRGLRLWLRQTRNHRRMRPLRRVEADYALLDDTGHAYALLHYYIGVAAQRRQLANAGFELLDVFNGEGQRLGADENGSSDLVLLYVARKIAA